jgi:tetratricopeptide (TPR) repeat protein
MKSLSIHVIRSFVVSVVLFQLPLLSNTGGVATAQTRGQAAEQADIDALQKLAQREGESGQTVEAIRDYQRVLEQRPEWKEGWWNLGVLQYSANRFADARSTLQHVVEFAPDLSVAWSLLGLSEFETRDFAGALAHLEKAQTLGIKDDAETERVSTYHLGLLLVRTGKFERASDLLLTTFGGGTASEQVKIALGLAMLRVPLLPEEIDPSQEALVLAAGGVVSAGPEALSRFPGLLQTYPNVPYLHYAYGLALAKAGRDREAIKLMRDEIAVSPASPLPWIEISRLQLRAGALNEALSAAKKAVDLGPNSKSAHENLAAVLESAGDISHAAIEKRTAESLTAHQEDSERRIIVRYSNASASSLPDVGSKANEELWQRAMQKYGQGQYAASADDLKTWLRQNPDNGTGWAVLGLDEFALKDFDNALIHMDRGANLGLSGSPESLQSARYTYGTLLIHAGEFDRASEVLTAALKAGQLDEKVEYARGLALLHRREFPEQVKEQDTELVRTAGTIASMLRNSHYDAAFPQFQRLLKQYPSAPFLHYAYGTALLAVSEFDEAATQMKAERTVSPQSELPCVRLASIALRQHNSADAIAWARQAVRLAANSAEAHYLLGRASLESGDVATAVHELEVASKLSPASPEVHFNLAKAYARAKRPQEAEQERATFSQLNEIAESQRSRSGSQIYAGPHDGVDVTTAPPAQAAPSPRSN